MKTTSDGVAQRFEPNVQMAWGQKLIYCGLGAITITGLDYFKHPESRGPVRMACIAGGGFIITMAIFWFRSARQGCQTVVLDDTAVTLENNNQRAVLPWDELAEITIVGDYLLKLQSRNAREPFKLENIGFTPQQWQAIKQTFQARGYEFKTSYSPL